MKISKEEFVSYAKSIYPDAEVEIGARSATLRYTGADGSQREVAVKLPAARPLVHAMAALAAVVMFTAVNSGAANFGLAALILLPVVVIGIAAIQADNTWPSTMSLRLERAMKGSKELNQHLEAYFQVWFMVHHWPWTASWKSPLALVPGGLIDEETQWIDWLAHQPIRSVLDLLVSLKGDEGATKTLANQQLLDGLAKLIQENMATLARGYSRGRIPSAWILLIATAWMALAALMLLSRLS